MQLLDIVLYNKDGQKRILPFETGKVNIITGDSKTGKTSVIDIIDYCFGSSFNIKEGIVKRYVWWYGVRFQLESGELFVARPNPTKYDRSGSDVYFIQGDNVSIPEFKDLKQNLNSEILLYKLASIIGIEEYVHKPTNFTRPEIPVTFKHSRFYSFQPQPDVDQPGHLFYHQTKADGRVAQAMKDTLPYFLGAIETGNIKLERELAAKRRDFNRLSRELKQAEAVVDRTLGQVFNLISEAKQVGLIDLNHAAKDRDEGLKILQFISEIDTIQETANVENQILLEFQAQRAELNKELDLIRQNIRDTENYQKETQGYLSEATHQANRLKSIDLYPQNSEVNNEICPLCEQNLQTSIPKIEDLKKSLLGLQNNLRLTKKESPKLKEYLTGLHESQNKLMTQVREVEKSISAIYKEQVQAKRLKDLNIRKGRVLGRISLYLESKVEVNDFSETKKKINSLKNEIARLEKQLSEEDKEDKLEGILDQLSVQMTSWSKDLEMEFKDRTIKFDIKKLTLFIISPERKIRFDQTGSGENWVAYHLLIHYALHKYFTVNKRPTPRFLVIDQMSQAYFPPEKDFKKTGEIEQSEDDKAIRRLFDFVFKRTQELEGKFQTIIIDHAKLNDDKFKDAIQEEWRKGKKLVPMEWINKEEEKTGVNKA